MKALQIQSELVNQMSEMGIVVCGGQTPQGESVLHIDVSHKSKFPELPEVDIVTDSDLAARVAELEAINIALIEALNEKNIIP